MPHCRPSGGVNPKPHRHPPARSSCHRRSASVATEMTALAAEAGLAAEKEAEVLRLRRRLEAAEGALEAAKVSLEGRAQEVQELRGRVGDLEGQRSEREQDLETENALLQGKVKELETHSARLHDTVKKMGKELEDLTLDLEEQEQQV